MKYLLSAIFLMIVGCSASKHFTSKGEELYYEKCTGCHRLHDKGEYDSAEWYSIMEKMSKKSHLSDDEGRAIIKYLTDRKTK
ncbi:MAG: hypothetical protein M1495_12475 [Bacteroidetes bacterium]|nr:hypothetical protein [Bacteroidota bacterium]MCL6098582.1 hypothetical protein [Bacteroidota bacterium]